MANRTAFKMLNYSQICQKKSIYVEHLDVFLLDTTNSSRAVGQFLKLILKIMHSLSFNFIQYDQLIILIINLPKAHCSPFPDSTFPLDTFSEDQSPFATQPVGRPYPKK